MSSKRRIRRKQCTGKIRHLCAAAGREHITKLRRANPGTGRLNVYLCNFCNGYHVGHG